MRNPPALALLPFLAAPTNETLPSDDAAARRARRQMLFANAFQEIVRSFLLPAGLFFGAQVVLHAVFDTADHEFFLFAFGLVTSVSSLGLFWILGRTKIGYRRLEAVTFLIIILVTANLYAHAYLHPEHANPIMFVLLAMGAATISVSLRLMLVLVAVQIGLAVQTAVAEGLLAPAQYVDVIAGAVFASIGLALLVRAAMGRLIAAWQDAERGHQDAKNASESDFLTGLPNRRAFFRAFERAVADRADNGTLALGLIDLNGFKVINDLHGHGLGDQLLIEIGRRLRKALGDEAFLARLGGDEFAVLVSDFDDDRVLRRIGEQICACVNAPLNLQGTDIVVSAGVGFAKHGAEIAGTAQLYEFADYALYRAKSARHAAIEIFTGADAAALRAIKSVEHHLRAGDLEDEMSMEYQPLVSTSDRRVIGFEALARWNSPELGRVAPDVFIRAAERSGQISQLTPMFLKKALADAMSWPDDLRLSFNLSARDVVSKTAFRKICHIVSESGFPSHRIDFEITETAIMADYESVRAALSCFRKLGARVALDDFGVGYSNFQHLDELAIDKVKIDRRFVTHMGSERNSGRIVRTMIEMCNALGMNCIVEGVETGVELDAVVKAGGSVVQGFYFSKPLRSDAVPGFLAQFGTRAVNSVGTSSAA